jgi:molecular chaperone DnaK
MTVVPFRPRHQATRQSQSLSASPTSSSLRPPAGVQAVGIDLGTTNSVVSVFTQHLEQPTTLRYADDSFLVPSVVHWNPITGKETVGRAALADAAGHVAELIRSSKRSMGVAGQSFLSNEKSYAPEQVAAAVLSHLAGHENLKKEAEEHNGLWAVVTVPAHFDDAARLATIAAAEAANINVLRIVNEPTAAALAYSMLPDVRHIEKETLVVYDLGGGTFDVSVVERDGLVFNVLASEGDVKLGGDDFDTVLAEHLLSRVTPQLAARRIRPGTAAFKRLLVLAEDAKKSFQTEGEVHVHCDALDETGASIDCIISRDFFESLVAPLVQKTLSLTERAIHAARKKAKNISRILLVGGSTRVTFVRKMLEQYFSQCLVDARLEPDLAVSWGAAVQAAIILGIEPNTILVDVCSHSLGVGVAEDSRSIDENFKKIARKYGLLGSASEEQLHLLLGDRLSDFQSDLRGLLRAAPIIHRNSALPAKRSEFFSTLYADQPAVQVIVVQGEGETVAENRLIGTFMFPLKQPCPAGSQCEIQLTYDQNGMVHVLAKQLKTDNQAEAVFDSRTGEVTGWVSVSDESESLASHPLEITSTTSEHTRSHDAPQTAANSNQQNAILVRARRQLMRLGTDSPKKDALMELISRYETLLQKTLSGEDCDEEMEQVESLFEDEYEG